MRRGIWDASNILLLLLVFGLATGARAQTAPPVQTLPSPGTTLGGNSSATIGTGGGTFQQIWAASPQRRGCTIINEGSHTMWVSEGLAASTATETLAVPLIVGQAYFCGAPGGIVLTGVIAITGTSGEAFYAAQY